VVLLGILIGWWGEVDKKGVEILGEINSEFPTPIFPPRVLESLKDFQNSIQPSIIIAILGFIGASPHLLSTRLANPVVMTMIMAN
jgi:MFS superfamily sulfate permease-like transporter